MTTSQPEEDEGDRGLLTRAFARPRRTPHRGAKIWLIVRTLAGSAIRAGTGAAEPSHGLRPTRSPSPLVTDLARLLHVTVPARRRAARSDRYGTGHGQGTSAMPRCGAEPPHGAAQAMECGECKPRESVCVCKPRACERAAEWVEAAKRADAAAAHGGRGAGGRVWPPSCLTAAAWVALAGATHSRARVGVRARSLNGTAQPHAVRAPHRARGRVAVDPAWRASPRERARTRTELHGTASSRRTRTMPFVQVTRHETQPQRVTRRSAEEPSMDAPFTGVPASPGVRPLWRTVAMAATPSVPVSLSTMPTRGPARVENVHNTDARTSSSDHAART